MLSHLLHFAAAAAAAVTADPSAPQFLNSSELITSDDYPAIALDQGLQGSVTVRLKVDRNGFVESCKIEVSSGHLSLDDQTCAVYRARARFAPARDSHQRAVAATYIQSVTWRLEGDEPALMPRQPWMQRSTLSVSAEGSLVGCKVESIGAPPPSTACDQFKATAPARDASTKVEPIAGFAITETYFYPVPSAAAAPPPILRDATQIARQISEITINHEGRVTGCKGVRYFGAANPENDICPGLREQRFAPASAVADLVATLVVTAYMRTNSVT